MKDQATINMQSRAVITRLAQIVFCVIVCLAVLDAALRVIVPKTNLLNQTVDIQSAGALYTKLEQIRGFDGRKIIVLGDSLAFGRAMREHGDKDWQDHNLPAQLQATLAEKNPEAPLMVANLGMNGVQPADLDELVRIIQPLKPDLVIFDLTLRSFSREFEEGENLMSRPWLKEVALNTDGRPEISSFRGFMQQAWYLYRIRDSVQAVLFDGQPAQWFAAKRDQLDSKLKGSEPQAADNFILLMKARGRYDQVDLAVDNPQRLALESLLKRLESSGQQAIGFYATENRDVLADLIERSRYNELQSQLRTLMNSAGSSVAWVGPLAIYAPENYLDHVHLDREGYRKLTQYLLPRIEKATRK